MKHLKLFEEFTERYDQLIEFTDKGAIRVENVQQLNQVEHALTQMGYKEHVIGVDDHTIPDDTTTGVIWSTKREWDRVNFDSKLFVDFDKFFKLKPQFKGWETGHHYDI